MPEQRAPRGTEEREATTRQQWRPPETLPTPTPQTGYTFHWVRISTQGQTDGTNVSSKLREGWVPVKASDHPEIHMAATENARFKDNIVIGGLMLCKAPTELVEQRNAFYGNQARAQIQSVDNNLMRENDSRMPLFNDRKSTVTFGQGN